MRKISQTITVEVNEQVDVNIDLGVDEIVNFVQECSLGEKNAILAALKQLPTNTSGLVIKTLDDVLRFEVLCEAYNKYNIFELEERLK